MIRFECHGCIDHPPYTLVVIFIIADHQRHSGSFPRNICSVPELPAAETKNARVRLDDCSKLNVVAKWIFEAKKGPPSQKKPIRYNEFAWSAPRGDDPVVTSFQADRAKRRTILQSTLDSVVWY